MLTLKRYWNFSSAALDKTLLEDYEVLCVFFDEYTNTLGLYFLFPVRLMVADHQLQRAAQILAYAKALPVPTDDAAAANDQAPARVIEGFPDDAPETVESSESNNPWEILAVAYLFLVPGIGFLLERIPLMLFVGGRRGNRYLVLSPFDLHLVGAGLVCMALLLTVSYLYTRQAIGVSASQTQTINPQTP